jgi:hypothetical protein
MLLQLAAQDIGQLTDIEPRRIVPDHSPAPTADLPGRTTIMRQPPGLSREGQRADDDSAQAAWSV